jgi:prepilin-type N-terminal cleavage/methylation domain-containing protein
MKLITKRMKSKKGFTLIELIVVVAILAILAAVAVPNFVGMSERAQTATEIATAAEWANAINIHNTLALGDSSITAIGDVVKGAMVAAPAIQAELVPVSDVADPDTYVFPRISISGGIAKVEDKSNLH